MSKELEFENSVKNILEYIGEDISREGLEKLQVELEKLLNLCVVVIGKIQKRL